MKIIYIIILALSLMFIGPVFGKPKRQTQNKIAIDAQPLKDVINLIRVGAKVNIVVRWNVLESMGIEKNTEITMKLHNVSWGKLLELILDQAGAGEVELAYTVDDGVLIISTKEDLSRKQKTKTYNIRDLLIKIPNFKGPGINIANTGQGGQQQGGLGGGRFIEGGGQGGNQSGGFLTDDGDDEEDQDDPVDPIIELIISTIDPESWRVSGGNVGSVSVLGPQLIVTQTSTAHIQIRDL